MQEPDSSITREYLVPGVGVVLEEFEGATRKLSETNVTPVPEARAEVLDALAITALTLLRKSARRRS